MTKLRLIVVNEYLIRVRARSFLISTLLAPLFIVGILLGPALLAEHESQTARSVIVVNESGDRTLFDDLQRQIGDPQQGGDGEIRLSDWGQAGGIDAAREVLAPEIEEGDYDGLLYLEPEFLEDGEAVFYAADPSGVVWADPIESALSRLLVQRRLADYGLREADLDDLMVSARLKAQPILGEGSEEGALEGRLIIGFIMVFLLYMMILTYGIQAMNAVIEDKNSRVVEVMLSNVTPTTLMAGKILASAMVGLTQFSIWGLLAVGLMGRGVVEMPAGLDLSFLSAGLWISFTAFFLLGYLLFACLYAAVGAMCNNVQDAQQFQMPITMLIVLPILLLQVVMQNPNGQLAVVLSLIPFFTPIMMFMRIALGSPPLWQVVLGLVLLSATVLLMARLTGKLFRISILSFGKTPSWKQVWAMLRAPE